MIKNLSFVDSSNNNFKVVDSKNFDLFSNEFILKISNGGTDYEIIVRLQEDRSNPANLNISIVPAKEKNTNSAILTLSNFGIYPDSGFYSPYKILGEINQINHDTDLYLSIYVPLHR